jgi:hypothetical protein
MIRRAAMTKTLMHVDIRDLLRGFDAAIELDQLRGDAMPAARLHPAYEDSMWRGWRRDHISYPPSSWRLFMIDGSFS